MRSKFLIWCLLFFTILATVSGQCIAVDSLLKEVKRLYRDTSVHTDQKIQWLSQNEPRFTGCADHFDSTHAFFWRTAARIYLEGSAFTKAIRFSEKSIAILNQLRRQAGFNQEALLPAYYVLGASNDSLHRVIEKMRAVDSCISISMNAKSINAYYLWALLRKTIYLFDLGDYHSCIQVSNLCEALSAEFCKLNPDQEHWGVEYMESSLVWHVNALTLLRRYDEAKVMLLRKIEEGKNAKFKSNKGVVYGLLGEVLQYKGEYKEAFKYHKLALKFELLNKHAFNYKSGLNYLGYEFYFKYLKDLDKALEYYYAALNYKAADAAEPILSSLESLNIYDRIGILYSTKYQYDSALKYIQLAFDQIKPGFTESELLRTPLEQYINKRRLGYIANLIIDKAEILYSRFKSTGSRSYVNDAIIVYKVADQFLERIKTEQSHPKSKLFWRSDRRRLYEGAINACFSAGNTIDAFYFFERSRAVLLYDQLNEQRFLNKGDITRQTGLRRRIAELDNEIVRIDKASDLSKELQQQRISNQQELDKLITGFRQNNPLFYQTYLSVGEDLLQDIQDYLRKENSTLIEFFDGDSTAFCLIVEKNKVLLNRLNKRLFDSTVNKFIYLLSDRNRMNSAFDEFAKTSRKLHKILFQEENFFSDRIIISPDSRYFPVEALVVNEGPAKPVYFLENHIVSYAHSARFLMVDFSGGIERASGTFLGIAPVNFPSSQVALTGSDKSLQALDANFNNTQIRTFKEATKRNFLDHFGNYLIIQLYTHASDQIENGEPEIYFADSVLYLSELISGKRPCTQLVVLSACETGTGQWFSGEGVFSFSRGFASLGVPSSITNLWSVESRSTYKLTQLLYKYLRLGLKVDLALQKAKVEFIKTGSMEEQLPYYWSATVLAGKTDSIKIERSTGLEWFARAIAGLILSCTLIVLWFSFRKKSYAVPGIKELSFGGS